MKIVCKKQPADQPKAGGLIKFKCEVTLVILHPFTEAVSRGLLQHRCFPVNFEKVFKTFFFIKHLRTTASVF